MSPERLVLVGIGGFGREVADIIDACNSREPSRYELIGALDDNPTRANLDRLAARDIGYLGTTLDWLKSCQNATYVIGIANANARKRIDTLFSRYDLIASVLRHPDSTVGSQCFLGPGSILCAGSRLTTNVVSGRHAHFHVNSTVGHDTRVHSYASVYPLAAVSGECDVGAEATVGANSVVLQGIELGEGSFVGAGAVVVRDVTAGSVVKGVPARPSRESIKMADPREAAR